MDNTIDRIYAVMDALMYYGDFEAIDDFIQLIWGFSPDTTIGITLLTASLPVRNGLKTRTALYKAVQDIAISCDYDADKLLKGLE